MNGKKFRMPKGRRDDREGEVTCYTLCIPQSPRKWETVLMLIIAGLITIAIGIGLLYVWIGHGLKDFLVLGPVAMTIGSLMVLVGLFLLIFNVYILKKASRVSRETEQYEVITNTNALKLVKNNRPTDSELYGQKVALDSIQLSRVKTAGSRGSHHSARVSPIGGSTITIEAPLVAMPITRVENGKMAMRRMDTQDAIFTVEMNQANTDHSTDK